MEYKKLVNNIYRIDNYNGYIYAPTDKEIVLIDIPDNIDIVEWVTLLDTEFGIKNIKYIILQYNQNNFISFLKNLKSHKVEPTIICPENVAYYNYNFLEYSSKWVLINDKEEHIKLSNDTNFYVRSNPLLLGNGGLITVIPKEQLLFSGLLFSSIINNAFFEDNEANWFHIINFTNSFLPHVRYENEENRLFLNNIKTILPSIGPIINFKGNLFLDKFIENEKIISTDYSLNTKDKILNRIGSFISNDKLNKINELSLTDLMEWIENKENGNLNLLIKPFSIKILHNLEVNSSVNRFEVSDLKHKLIETTIDQITNPITELFNSNFFNKSMHDELEKRVENRKNGSLLYIQLNEKEHINNVYNKDTNNRILFNLARGFESFIEESSDRVKHRLFHLDNDIFCYYIPEGNIEYFLFIAEKIQQMVKNRTFFTEDLTISVGIVTFSEVFSLDKNIKSIFNYLNERAVFRLKYALLKDLNHINFEVLQEDFDNLELKQSKIVVISSDDTYRDVLSFNLRTNGFEVIELTNGLSAYNYIEESFPDLIICDNYIPKLDALSLKERLNNKLKLRRIPFILTTSTKSDELITRAHTLNILHILKYPILFKEIVGLSSKLLEGIYGEMNE